MRRATTARDITVSCTERPARRRGVRLSNGSQATAMSTPSTSAAAKIPTPARVASPILDFSPIFRLFSGPS